MGASFLLELSFVRVCLSAWPSPHLCVHTVVPLVYFVSLLLLALLSLVAKWPLHLSCAVTAKLAQTVEGTAYVSHCVHTQHCWVIQ